MKFNKFLPLLFILLTISGCKEKLVHDLQENDANKLMAQLYAVNAEPRKIQQSDGKWTIAVPEDQASWVMKYLDEARVMREASPIEPASVMSGRDEQRFKYERALSREIEYTLSSLDKVLQVRVHLNLPARDPMFGRKISEDEKGSGSVLLVVAKDFSATENEISKLVSGASGIAAKEVSVLINRSDISALMPTVVEEALPVVKKVEAPAVAKVQKRSFKFSFSPNYEVIASVAILLLGIIWLMMKKKTKRAQKNKFAGIAQALKAQTAGAVNE